MALSSLDRPGHEEDPYGSSTEEPTWLSFEPQERRSLERKEADLRALTRKMDIQDPEGLFRFHQFAAFQVQKDSYRSWPNKVAPALKYGVDAKMEATANHPDWAFQNFLWAIRNCFEHAQSWFDAPPQDGQTLRVFPCTRADDLPLSITKYFCDTFRDLHRDVKRALEQAKQMEEENFNQRRSRPGPHFDVCEISYFDHPTMHRLAAKDSDLARRQLAKLFVSVGFFLVDCINTHKETCVQHAPKGSKTRKFLEEIQKEHAQLIQKERAQLERDETTRVLADDHDKQQLRRLLVDRILKEVEDCCTAGAQPLVEVNDRGNTVSEIAPPQSADTASHTLCSFCVDKDKRTACMDGDVSDASTTCGFENTGSSSSASARSISRSAMSRTASTRDSTPCTVSGREGSARTSTLINPHSVPSDRAVFRAAPTTLADDILAYMLETSSSNPSFDALELRRGMERTELPPRDFKKALGELLQTKRVARADSSSSRPRYSLPPQQQPPPVADAVVVPQEPRPQAQRKLSPEDDALAGKIVALLQHRSGTGATQGMQARELAAELGQSKMNINRVCYALHAAKKINRREEGEKKFYACHWPQQQNVPVADAVVVPQEPRPQAQRKLSPEDGAIAGEIVALLQQRSGTATQWMQARELASELGQSKMNINRVCYALHAAQEINRREEGEKKFYACHWPQQQNVPVADAVVVPQEPRPQAQRKLSPEDGAIAGEIVALLQQRSGTATQWMQARELASELGQSKMNINRVCYALHAAQEINRREEGEKKFYACHWPQQQNVPVADAVVVPQEPRPQAQRKLSPEDGAIAGEIVALLQQRSGTATQWMQARELASELGQSKMNINRVCYALHAAKKINRREEGEKKFYGSH